MLKISGANISPKVYKPLKKFWVPEGGQEAFP